MGAAVAVKQEVVAKPTSKLAAKLEIVQSTCRRACEPFLAEDVWSSVKESGFTKVVKELVDTAKCVGTISKRT